MASLIGGVAAIVLQGRRAVLAAVTLATATAVAYGAAAMLLLPRLAADMYPYPALGRLVAERVTPAVALGSIGAHTALVYYADRPVTFLATPSDAARFLSPSEPRLLVLSRREFETVKDGAPMARELASRRRRNPRLSRLLDGRFMTGGTEELLVGNAAAAAIYSHAN